MYEEASRLLNGPTTETWIDPWMTYLRSKGINWFPDTNVDALLVEGGAVTGARVTTGGQSRTITADMYVLAVPVERAREPLGPQLRSLDPAFTALDDLVADWMTGIQYFLRWPLPIARGHIRFADSPWAITSVSQGQFWSRDLSTDGNGTVRDIISADVSNWDAPGILYGKTARRDPRRQRRAAARQHRRLVGRTSARAQIWNFEEPPIFFFSRLQHSIRYALGLPHVLADPGD